MHILNIFYSRMNKRTINNDIGISSFRNGLNQPFSSPGVYFKTEITEGSHEVKKQQYII